MTSQTRTIVQPDGIDARMLGLLTKPCWVSACCCIVFMTCKKHLSAFLMVLPLDSHRAKVVLETQLQTPRW